jgi:hypothetical protein
MKWAGHVIRTWRGERHTVFDVGIPKERDYVVDLGIDERIILNLIFKK